MDNYIGRKLNDVMSSNNSDDALSDRSTLLVKQANKIFILNTLMQCSTITFYGTVLSNDNGDVLVLIFQPVNREHLFLELKFWLSDIQILTYIIRTRLRK